MFVCPECGAAQSAGGHCPADGAAVAAIGEDVLLGTAIGAYRVARLLGIGGMGRVYKGVHPTIGSRVAIKVLSRECSDRRELVDRFFAEAKAVNLIRHENIVNVLDLAVLPDGRPYIIMEYLDGAPLAANRRRGGRARAAVAARRARASRGGGARRAGRRAREGDRPPRSETGQHLCGAVGAAEGARLRHREAQRSVALGDAHGLAAGYASLYGAGAGGGAAGRSPRGHLRDGRDPVRVLDGAEAVRGRVAVRICCGSTSRRRRRRRGRCGRTCRRTSST